MVSSCHHHVTSYFCAPLTSTLLDGFGFQTNSTITVLDEVNGNKVGWPLGAILYEINSLPWELVTPDRQPWGKLFLAAVTGTEQSKRPREGFSYRELSRLDLKRNVDTAHHHSSLITSPVVQTSSYTTRRITFRSSGVIPVVQGNTHKPLDFRCVSVYQ
jgi:hypothetical protein